MKQYSFPMLARLASALKQFALRGGDFSRPLRTEKAKNVEKVLRAQTARLARKKAADAAKVEDAAAMAKKAQINAKRRAARQAAKVANASGPSNRV